MGSYRQFCERRRERHEGSKLASKPRRIAHATKKNLRTSIKRNFEKLWAECRIRNIIILILPATLPPKVLSSTSKCICYVQRLKSHSFENLSEGPTDVFVGTVGMNAPATLGFPFA